MKSLFGEEVSSVPLSKLPFGKFKLWKIQNRYRRGTLFRCCKWCANFSDTGFKKCHLMGESMSSASDIRCSWVCDKYQEE